MDLTALDRLSKKWGVAVDSLVYRCREVGAVSDPAYRRAYQRLNHLRRLGLFQPEPVNGYPGEIPILINRAFALAESHGLTAGSHLLWRLHSRSGKLRWRDSDVLCCGWPCVSLG
jgi:hypothetical protein